MTALLAGVVLFVAADCLTSLLVWLPAAAIAESLPPHRPTRETLLWFVALLLPHLLAAAAVGYAVRLHALDPVAWSVRNGLVRHLCFWGLATTPDASYRMTTAAWVAVALLLAGLLRPLGSAMLSWRYGRLLEGASEDIPELEVRLTPLETAWSTCVGFLRSRVYITRGLAAKLDAGELAAVIAHEQAHAAARDNLKSLLAQAAFGSAIGVPSTHYYYGRLRACLERAADRTALRSQADATALASALVTAARKLRESSDPPDERGFRAWMAARHREELVATRVGLVLEASGEGRSSEERSVPRRAALLVSTLVVAGLLVAGADLVKPSVRCLYESVLAALSGHR